MSVPAVSASSSSSSSDSRTAAAVRDLSSTPMRKTRTERVSRVWISDFNCCGRQDSIIAVVRDFIFVFGKTSYMYGRYGCHANHFKHIAYFAEWRESSGF